MSDIGEPMKSSILGRLRAGICDDTCRVRDAASGCACAEAADRIEQLEAFARRVAYLFEGKALGAEARAALAKTGESE